MENKETTSPSMGKTPKKVRSPGQIAGIAFGLTIVAGLCTTIGIVNFALLFGGSEALAKFNEAVVEGLCPTAILVALVAYFWAKRRQDVGGKSGMMDMMSCPKCFHLNPPGANHCERCRTDLQTTDSAPDAPVPDNKSQPEHSLINSRDLLPEEQPSESDLPQLAAPLPIREQCQSINRDGVQCGRKPIFGSRWCWQHNISFIVSLVGILGVLLFLLGLQTGLINYTFINPTTSYDVAMDNGKDALENEEYDRAVAYFRYAAKKAHSSGDDVDENVALYKVGDAYRLQGEYDKALKYYRDSKGAQSLYNNGLIHLRQGEYKQALDQLKMALPLVQDEGDQEWEGNLLNTLGIVCMDLENYDQALDYFTEALQVSQESGDHSLEMMVTSNLGIFYNLQGDKELALKYFKLAGSADKLYEIGVEKFKQEDYDEALEIFNQVLIIEQGGDNREAKGNTLNIIGNIYALKRQYKQALDFYNQSLNMRKSLGDHAGTGRVLFNIGQVHHSQGEYKQALEYLSQALATFKTYGFSEDEKYVVEAIDNLIRDNIDWEQQIRMARQWPVITADSFELDQLKWKFTTSNHHKVNDHYLTNDGKYRWEISSGTTGTFDYSWPDIAHETASEEFYLSVAIEVIENPGGNAVGITYFINPPSKSSYTFAIEPSNMRYIIPMLKNDTWTLLRDWTKSSSIKSQGPNRIEVLRLGTVFVLFINGEVVDYFVDNQLQQDKEIPAVSISINPNDKMIVDFDDFEFRTP